MASPKNKQLSTVRIIGGRWKRRRIPVVGEGIRPTSDRVRETAFNWMGGEVASARCLDMFAGTGALGIEALSRGARETLFVEQNRAAATAITSVLQEFGASGARVLCADASTVRYSALGPFDIAFIDPPFAGPQLVDLCKLLEQQNCLAARAHVYMEMDRHNALPELPTGWDMVRDGTAGQVRFALARRLVGDEH